MTYKSASHLKSSNLQLNYGHWDREIRRKRITLVEVDLVLVAFGRPVANEWAEHVERHQKVIGKHVRSDFERRVAHATSAHACPFETDIPES